MVPSKVAGHTSAWLDLRTILAGCGSRLDRADPYCAMVR